MAALRGRLEIVKWLCEMKADVECTDTVRAMCVFEVLYVVYVKCQCCCAIYMCYECFDNII